MARADGPVEVTKPGRTPMGRVVEPAALEAALRRFHTRATVVPQSSLATLGGPVWYVYRDGHAGVRVDKDWWQRPDIAEIVVHAVSREILEANNAACALVDLAPSQLVGWDTSRLVPVLEPAVAAGSASSSTHRAGSSRCSTSPGRMAAFG